MQFYAQFQHLVLLITGNMGPQAIKKLRLLISFKNLFITINFVSVYFSTSMISP